MEATMGLEPRKPMVKGPAEWFTGDATWTTETVQRWLDRQTPV
jgi:hypothetical protein